jgi:hypothetical protein
MKAFMLPSRALAAVLATAALASLPLAVACGSSPSSPTPNPTPAPTPTPVPTPTPDPDVPPAGSGCGKPYPPMITRFQASIHQKDVGFWQIDSTPLVGPDYSYCLEIGFTDGRTICPVRPEGAPDREACELWRIGKAKDTGKNEVTWTFIGKDGKESYCSTTDAPDAPCWRYNDGEHHTQVKAITGGLYRACSEAGACGQVDVDRNL